jgi:hypothetical protein
MSERDGNARERTLLRQVVTRVVPAAPVFVIVAERPHLEVRREIEAGE